MLLECVLGVYVDDMCISLGILDTSTTKSMDMSNRC